MTTIKLQLDDDTFARAQALAKQRGCTLSQLIAQLVTDGDNGDREPHDDAPSVVGLFADEPELLDAVVADAMRAREGDPWKRGHG